MEVRDYEELKKKICKQLEDMTNSSKFGMAEIEAIDKLIHTIKNISTIVAMEGEDYSQDMGMSRGRYSRDEYSQTGRYSRDGGYSNNNYSYDGDSYASRRGMHYVRGHYSRAEEDMTSGIEEMLNSGNLSGEDKNTLRRALEVLRK